MFIRNFGVDYHHENNIGYSYLYFRILKGSSIICNHILMCMIPYPKTNRKKTPTIVRINNVTLEQKKLKKG